MSCCQSCTFCLKCERAATKERRKSLIKSESRNKNCEKCFFCRSLRFCPHCSKCPQCCQCSPDRGTSPKILAEVVPPGCKSESSVHFEGRLHSPIQNQTPFGKGSIDSQWLCKPPQEPLPEGGFAGLAAEGGSRDGEGSNISSLLQPTVHSSKTKPKMATNLGPQCSKQIFERKNIQNGNPRNNSDFLATGGMGDIVGLQRRLFPHSSSYAVPEISQVPFPKSVFSVQGPSLRPLHRSDGVHLCGQRGQVNGSIPGYKDPPVPRRLVDSSPYQRILPPGHSIPPRPLPGVGLDNQCTQVRTRTQTDFRVRGLQVRSLPGTGLTDPEPVGVDPSKVGIHPIQTKLPSQELHVPDRPTYSDGKTGSPGETPHETHPVAPKTTLESSRIPGKGDSCTKVTSPTPSMVDQGDKCLDRTTLAPFESCRANLYRRLKRRLGCSLRRLHSKRRLVSSRKSSSHKLPGTKSGLTGLEKVPALGTRQSSSSCHGQHDSCGIHQQGRRYEVRLTLCPSMATPVLVQSETGSPKGQTHPWSSECDCRQIVSSRPSHSDRMVTAPRGLRPHSSDLAPSPGGHVCNKVQLQTSPICVSSAGPQCLGSGRPNSLVGKPGHVCFSPSIVTGQGGQQTVGPSLQESDPHSSGLAQHAMVLGPGGTVVSDPSLPTQSSRPSDTAIQQGASQESDQSKPTRLAPRAEAIKEQGFSSPVASRIEAPQRSSTRTVYEAKWAVFVRWCESSQVDFRSPSVKQIADFLLHLFQEKNLQPSTIDGYRSAIADKLGNSSLNVSKDENLTRLLDSFHRDRPKGRRGIPSWNLSLVLHQLTKPPFEPLRKASLKHLTFKTVFLLALGSGKRRSEIHAWLNKNIRHQADWSKVSLYPSPMFLAKNHLAKEGPECVAPVVIPALAPTLDKSLKEDRSLCPVRALRYYLDKTQDVRQGKELVFVSFKKGFTKDISPATISSWIKQTVILCYDLSDQESLTLHQVKAHDVRAFAASKAFQGGISLDQILAACHWKSHNTFTQFYLKDVAWADSELFHLGPVVAAQQIHQ